MNNVELAKKVEGYLKGSAAKAKKFEDLVAVSISLLSENSEDMYVTVREGKILVAPFAYDDNNCAIEASAEVINKMFSGELSFDDALANGSVQVKSGDPAKLKALECLVPSAKSAKAAKAPAKSAVKAPDKTAAKVSEKKTNSVPAAKPVEKKEVAAKPAEKKEVAAKPAEKKEVAAKPAEKKEVAAKPAEKKEVAAKPVEKKEIPVSKAPDKKPAKAKNKGKKR